MKKKSDHVEAARKLVPAAEDFVHSAADRVGPLAQSAADRVGPLAEAAADRIGAVADRLSPIAHSAAERVGPLAQTAADKVGPLAHTAADRVAPLAHSAADKVAPLAQSARELVGPYAQQAADAVAPYTQQAAERIAPLASSARQRGAEVAHQAVERISAARGELAPAVPINPPRSKKGAWLKRLAIVGAIAGVVYVVARKFLGSQEPDWQAARPTTPYAPPPPAAAPSPAAETEADATDDPQGGASAHDDYVEANGQAEPAQPVEGGDVAPTEPVGVDPVGVDPVGLDPVGVDPIGVDPVGLDPVVEPQSDADFDAAGEIDQTGAVDEVALEEPAAEPEPVVAAAEPKWSGEGVYVGTEPPEGYVIKGNERSMKYHVPESGGYSRTIAEVWFNSEEAAQQAGFVRAQR